MYCIDDMQLKKTCLACEHFINSSKVDFAMTVLYSACILYICVAVNGYEDTGC